MKSTIAQLNAQLPSERILFALKCLLEIKPENQFRMDTPIPEPSGESLAQFQLEQIPGIKEYRRDTKGRLDELSHYSRSIELLCSGKVSQAFVIMDYDERNGLVFDREIVSYHQDKELFMSQLKQLAKELSIIGY